MTWQMTKMLKMVGGEVVLIMKISTVTMGMVNTAAISTKMTVAMMVAEVLVALMEANMEALCTS